MRIIAGRFGGRRLVVPKGALRPTSDRVREAWLSILEPHLAGARVLDLWAGSGAVGLEALSRGARSVVFVEREARAVTAIRANIAALAADAATAVHRQDALRFAERLPAHAFDVVVADPPYESAMADQLIALFRAVPFSRILSVEHSARRTTAGDETRRYGSTAITFCHAP